MFFLLIAIYAQANIIAVVALIAAYIGGKKSKGATLGILTKKKDSYNNWYCDGENPNPKIVFY